MRTLYLDIFSGISGDMLVGALIDLGVDFHRLEQELAKLGLAGYHLHASTQQKALITGTKFDVHLAGDHEHAASRPGQANHGHSHAAAHDHGDSEGHHHPHHDEVGVEAEDEDEHLHAEEPEPTHSGRPGHGEDHRHPDGSGRTFLAIKQLLATSPFSDWVKTRAEAVFRRIAEAEGKIHGCPVDQVHFHEVGAIDSIVDVAGACLALEMLGKPRVLAQSVVEGTGWVECAHGRFPLPVPATLAILGARGIALSQCEEPHELVTPTGAALLAEFVESFGPMQDLVASKIGYGLGTRDLQSRPNVLRAVLCQEGLHGQDWEADVVAVLETNLDDVPGELLGHFMESALAAGALDVFHTPIQMKKNRPGILLTVLCPVEQAERFAELMLRQTSAFGVRRTVAERRKLQREFKTVGTPYGPVTVKLGRLNGQLVHAAPEYESCRQAAAQAGLSLQEVYEAATRCLNL